MTYHDDKTAIGRLYKSKYIRHVLEGRMDPEELDILIDRTRKRLRELEHTHILDTQAVSNLTVALERLVRADT